MAELSKAERKAAHEKVNAYFERKQAELLEPVLEAIDRYRRREIDVWDVDHIIHIYHRQSQELYSYINSYSTGSGLPIILRLIEAEEQGDEQFTWRPRTTFESDREH